MASLDHSRSMLMLHPCITSAKLTRLRTSGRFPNAALPSCNINGRRGGEPDAGSMITHDLCENMALPEVSGPEGSHHIRMSGLCHLEGPGRSLFLRAQSRSVGASCQQRSLCVELSPHASSRPKHMHSPARVQPVEVGVDPAAETAGS